MTLYRRLSRVLRVATFFSDSTRKWQVGITLLVVSVVDRLHWAGLGRRGGRPKARLDDTVDPYFSVVGVAMSSLLGLLKDWEQGGQWGLLKWFGLSDWSEKAPRKYARTTLVRLSAGLFRRTEQRFASWPYRLQWLISSGVSEDGKDQVANEFISAPDCSWARSAEPFGSVPDRRGSALQ